MVSQAGESGLVSVRYWAGAAAAAGRAEEQVSLAQIATLEELVTHLGQSREDLARVLATCSVLIGDQPSSSVPASTVFLKGGDKVEFLPPFAGG